MGDTSHTTVCLQRLALLGNDILRSVRAETMWEVECIQQTKMYKSKDAAWTCFQKDQSGVWSSGEAKGLKVRSCIHKKCPWRTFQFRPPWIPLTPIALLQAFQHAPSRLGYAESKCWDRTCYEVRPRRPRDGVCVRNTGWIYESRLILRWRGRKTNLALLLSCPKAAPTAHNTGH